jgi:hypothetical protein
VQKVAGVLAELLFVACSSRCEHDVCISGTNRLCTTHRNAASKPPLNPLALRCGSRPYRPVKSVVFLEA